MEFNIYISCPIATPQSTLNEAIRSAGRLDQEVVVRYWVRGTAYDLDDVIKTCDAFILMLPSNRFECRIESLPPGCKKELQQAIAHYRPIFIAYTNSSSEVNFYAASIRGGMISGISGSSNRLKDKIAPRVNCIHIPLTEDQLRWEVIVPPLTDKRLLLLLL